jgi:hypothetical protein
LAHQDIVNTRDATRKAIVRIEENAVELRERCRIREDVSIHNTRIHRCTATLPDINRTARPNTPVTK